MTPKSEFRFETSTLADGILIRYSWEPRREPTGLRALLRRALRRRLTAR